MLRPDEPLSVARLIASPALTPATVEALRRFAAGSMLACVSDADVNASFVSLQIADLTQSTQLKKLADIIGAQGAHGRALRLELQPPDPAALRDDALRAIAIELHGILQAPVYVGRRSTSVSEWAAHRPMSFGPAGLYLQSVAPVLPYGGSESNGLAIEVGKHTTILKVRLVGAALETSALAAIAKAVGGPDSGFVEAAAYPMGQRKDGASILVVELGDLRRTPAHRALQVLEIEAQRFGARLGLGALLSDAPLELFIGALGMHMGLPMSAAQVIETRVPQSAAMP